MVKSFNSRDFVEWNLVKTGNLFYNRFNSIEQTQSNVIVIRADFFHLKTFAK